jgi:hypothetical protein
MKPLQSKPRGVVPPHTYGEPVKLLAVEITLESCPDAELVEADAV